MSDLGSTYSFYRDKFTSKGEAHIPENNRIHSHQAYSSHKIWKESIDDETGKREEEINNYEQLQKLKRIRREHDLMDRLKGTCYKCGGSGHFSHQCHNFLEEEEMEDGKKKNDDDDDINKWNKKRKRKRERDDDVDDDLKKKKKKKKRKKKDKKEKKRDKSEKKRKSKKKRRKKRDYSKYSDDDEKRKKKNFN